VGVNFRCGVTVGPPALGAVHHLATVVADARGAAAWQERALGWRRISDEVFEGAEAEVLGTVLGASATTRFHTIMLEDPAAPDGARVELIDLDTEDGPGSEILPGVHVASYRVEDAAAWWEHLVHSGAEPVRSPVEFAIARWSMRVATVRISGPALLEVIEFR
jgi:uncharacterized glyoxalase superfamily protein PhnB